MSLPMETFSIVLAAAGFFIAVQGALANPT
jgi:hypothetical protein